MSTICPGCQTPFEPAAFRSVQQTHCDRCADRLWERYTREQRAAVLRGRFDAMVCEGLIQPATRTARFADLREDSVAMNPAAWETAKAATGNLYVYGDIGVGKTHLCRCILNRAFVNGSTVAETMAAEYVRRYNAFSADQWLRKLQQVDVLLFDDIDKANWRGDAIAGLWGLVDARASRKAITMVTANLDVGDVLKLMQAVNQSNSSIAMAALDRLKPVTKIQMKGRSLR